MFIEYPYAWSLKILILLYYKVKYNNIGLVWFGFMAYQSLLVI